MPAAFRRSSCLLGLALSILGCAPQVPPEEAAVRRAIDGDTVELRDGRLLRYIGIDTPEVRRRDAERWVEDPEPFGYVATEANRKLVDGRHVRLEYDVQRYDRYGRLLAYVYVTRPDGETVMVNEWLVEQGLAQPLTIPPNVKYEDRFRAAAKAARAANLGLWGRGNDPSTRAPALTEGPSLGMSPPTRRGVVLSERSESKDDGSGAPGLPGGLH